MIVVSLDVLTRAQRAGMDFQRILGFDDVLSEINARVALSERVRGSAT